MKKAQRLRIIQGLKEAQKLIKIIKCSVGVAIRRQSKLYGENPNPILRLKDVQILIEWMDELLEGKFYLEKWLKNNGHVYQGEEWLVETRVRWIEWMIQEMVKGD